MFDIGFGIGEIILLVTGALMIMGPKEFPKIMVKIGRFFRTIKDIGNEVKYKMDDIVHEDELLKMRQEIAAQLEDPKNDK